jgi:histidine ammonia-lyase
MHSFVCDQISIELNAATDNPLILLDEEGPNKAYSAGMFHGEPIGMAIDSLKIAICELGSISERRLYRLTTGNLSQRLPPGLVGKDKPALGMMVPQTTAAALVSENKSLAWPASVDSIPTCEDQEDHIAMSTVAARRCWTVLENARRVISIELLTVAHALAHRLDAEPHHQLGVGTQQGYKIVHDILFDLSSDAMISDQIERIASEIQKGAFVLPNSEAQ